MISIFACLIPDGPRYTATSCLMVCDVIRPCLDLETSTCGCGSHQFSSTMPMPMPKPKPKLGGRKLPIVSPASWRSCLVRAATVLLIATLFAQGPRGEEGTRGWDETLQQAQSSTEIGTRPDLGAGVPDRGGERSDGHRM